MSDRSRRRMLMGAGVAGAVAALLGAAGPAGADQPTMHDALAALREAERKLDHADRDKGGHRAKALSLVRKAIAEVERGIEYDRRHHSKDERH